ALSPSTTYSFSRSRLVPSPTPCRMACLWLAQTSSTTRVRNPTASCRTSNFLYRAIAGRFFHQRESAGPTRESRCLLVYQPAAYGFERGRLEEHVSQRYSV